MDDLVADAPALAPATTDPTLTDNTEAGSTPPAATTEGSAVAGGATNPAASADPARAAGSADPDRAAGLSERDVGILDFERHWWRHAGSKEQAIRDRFALSPTRYYQLLNALIDSPEALAYEPTLVKRLRRLRASRSRARSQRRLGGHP